MSGGKSSIILFCCFDCRFGLVGVITATGVDVAVDDTVVLLLLSVTVALSDVSGISLLGLGSMETTVSVSSDISVTADVSMAGSVFELSVGGDGGLSSAASDTGCDKTGGQEARNALSSSVRGTLKHFDKRSAN